MVHEYQRKCRSCGTIWHSLVSREQEMEKRIQADALQQLGGISQQCGTCGMCGGSTVAQSSHNTAAGMN